MTVSIVVAIGRGGAIGRANAIPWHLKEDLQHFKALTTGHAVVMGRRTWESIPAKFRPLPGRRNVVLTRGDGSVHRCIIGEGADEVHSTEVETCLRVLGHTWGKPIDVIGGAEVYAAALPYADRIEVTEVDVRVDGADAWFPLQAMAPGGIPDYAKREIRFDGPGGYAFREASRRKGEAPELQFVTWERLR